jgi:hypothetical protein
MKRSFTATDLLVHFVLQTALDLKGTFTAVWPRRGVPRSRGGRICLPRHLLLLLKLRLADSRGATKGFQRISFVTTGR